MTRKKKACSEGKSLSQPEAERSAPGVERASGELQAGVSPSCSKFLKIFGFRFPTNCRKRLGDRNSTGRCWTWSCWMYFVTNM